MSTSLHDATQQEQVRRLLGRLALEMYGYRDDPEWDYGEAFERIEDVLLSVAPEFIPPLRERTQGSDDWNAWDELVGEAMQL